MLSLVYPPEVGVELDFRIPQLDVHFSAAVDDGTLDHWC